MTATAKVLSTPGHTYADYLTWPEEGRWELIDGEVWDMSPAPAIVHQEVLLRLGATLERHFRRRPCRVLIAPCDLVLPAAGEGVSDATTVLQPDLLVVCDEAKVQERHILGAPDLVAEILSPSTARKDEGIKRDRYQRAGVPEYWLLHPRDRVVTRYTLAEGRYGLPEILGPEDGELRSIRFPELAVELGELFE